MQRRAFLSLLGLGSAGLVLDPERLLWVPGQKTIFLPPAQEFLKYRGVPLIYDLHTMSNRIYFMHRDGVFVLGCVNAT